MGKPTTTPRPARAPEDAVRIAASRERSAAKPIKGRIRLEAVENHERAARLFRHILEAAEERRELRRREAKTDGGQRNNASTGTDG